MPQRKAAIFAFGVFLGPGTLAHAMSVPFQDHLSLQYPGASKPAHDEALSPYAMTYSDEVAQSLGIKDGHMDFFATEPKSRYIPSFSAGVDRGGAMFRLKWYPGE